MATYKAEALYQRYRRRPRPPAHYSLGWLPRWARLASRAPGLANAALRAPGLAGLAKRLGGIDSRRPLPRFAAQTFRAWFARRPVPAGARAGAPVLLWVDTFTDYFTPEVGQAAVRVLEAAGYAVRITSGPACCGLTWISTGQLDGARRQLRRSLDALDPAIAGGVPVVGLEPSCTAVLRGEITELLPDNPRARQVRAATRTLAELLAATSGWEPPDLGGVRAVAQPHCHHHAVMGWHADSALLARGGAEVTAVGGCCGLAGNFGVERGHYDVSRAVAETALLPAVRAAREGDGDAVVLADGFSCRTQLDQFARVGGTHLAQLLASRLEDRRLPDRLNLGGLGDEALLRVVHAGLGGHGGPAAVHRHGHRAHRPAGDRPEHVAGRGDRGRGLALGQAEERHQRARAVRQGHEDPAVQHPGGRAQVRGPVQPGHHPVGPGLVEDQAELPGERHQRHEGVQVGGHDTEGYPSPSPASAIRAAMAGWRRSRSRQRARVGPMLPVGRPSLSLISAYGTGGSAVSTAISRWQQGGRSETAVRRAAWRSAASTSCSAASLSSSGISSAPGTDPAARVLRVMRRTRAHSRRVVVASQPGSAAGSRTWSSWSTRRIQTLWPTSWASASPSRYLRQIAQIIGA
jgi:Fe-S oxidoreductase